MKLFAFASLVLVLSILCIVDCYELGRNSDEREEVYHEDSRDSLMHIRRRLQRPRLRSPLAHFLTKAKINVRHFLDIGANKGDFTRQMLKSFPNANAWMIEGNSEHVVNWKDIIANGRGNGYTGVLANVTGEQTWYRHEKDVWTGACVCLSLCNNASIVSACTKFTLSRNPFS